MAVSFPLEAPPEQSGEPTSLDEWTVLPEDEPGEFVGGRLEEEELPDSTHEVTVSWLVHALLQWLGERGFVMTSDLKTIVGASGRKPDVTVFLEGTPPPPKRGPIRHPADILVEVVSPSPRDQRRDRVVKMGEYAAFGVRFYWLVDPGLGSFEIFQLNADGFYVKVVGVTGGVVDPVPGCAGLTIDLDRLWATLARLSE